LFDLQRSGAEGIVGGRISESTIREIREKADIVAIVSETVSLARSGSSFRGLCPFHREKTPSFFVHPSRQAFKCFGCGEGGSVFHFLMKARNLSFAEAVEEVGDRYGVAIQYEKGPPSKRPGEDLYRILRLAAETYRELLRSAPSGKQAREFLGRRGVTKEAEQEFFLGYGGQGKDLLSLLAREGIDPGRAAQAGLLFPKEGGGYRERFRGRVLFPVSDARGRQRRNSSPPGRNARSPGLAVAVSTGGARDSQPQGTLPKFLWRYTLRGGRAVTPDQRGTRMRCAFLRKTVKAPIRIRSLSRSSLR